MKRKPGAYALAGVNYDDLDPIKKHGLGLAVQTARFAPRGFTPEWGDSVFLYPGPGVRSVVGSVVEGLGTKNLRLESWARGVDEWNLWRGIGQDTLAMIVNDLAVRGIEPKVVHLYLALGGKEWSENPVRFEGIHEGWFAGCETLECLWGGGETPMLKAIIASNTVDLAGCAWGSQQKERLIPGVPLPGDAIMFLGAPGINANGLTLAGKIAVALPDGYDTVIDTGVNGRGLRFGDLLFKPTPLYALAVKQLIAAGIELHAARNITGDALLKLVRSDQPVRFVIRQVAPKLTIFKTLQDMAGMNDEEAYRTLNMGQGYAIVLPRTFVDRAIRVCESCGFIAWDAGNVEAAEAKQVVIPGLGITYN